MSPKISVIVPVYNVEKYIARCVDSLINQTLGDLEIILVDDGSTDQSGAICDEYASKDSRIKVLHKANAGQGLARNDGLKIASGEYVCFLDSDDYLEACAYEELYNLLKNTSADLCAYGYQIDSPEGRCIRVPKIIDRQYDNDEIIQEFLLHFFGDDDSDDNLQGVSSCMSAFRRSIIEENNVQFQSERKVFSEDTLFNLDFCRYVTRVITTSKVYYHYCMKADSFTKGYQRNRMELTDSFCRILKRYSYEYGINAKVSDRINMVLWISFMDSVRQEVARNDVTNYEKRKNISEIISSSTVLELLNRMNKDKLSFKQKAMYILALKKSCWGLYLLAKMRNCRGI